MIDTLKAFTRLCNAFLQGKNITIEEALDSGVLDDGWILGNLISAFTKKDIGRLDIPAKTRFNKLNNLTTCFNLLEKEGVKLVGIGPEGMSSFVSTLIVLDILSRNEKLILGLMWTLILKYHINAGPQPSEALPVDGGSQPKASQETMDSFVEDMGIGNINIVRNRYAVTEDNNL